MENIPKHQVPEFCLTLPAEEESPVELNCFLDAVITAICNTVDRENEEFRKFGPKTSLHSTTFGQKLSAPIVVSVSSTAFDSPLSKPSRKQTDKAEDNE